MLKNSLHLKIFGRAVSDNCYNRHKAKRPKPYVHYGKLMQRRSYKKSLLCKRKYANIDFYLLSCKPRTGWLWKAIEDTEETDFRVKVKVPTPWITQDFIRLLQGKDIHA